MNAAHSQALDAQAVPWSDARCAIVVAALAAVMLLSNLGGPRLWDRDEPRNARCAVEMLERNDWVTPYFNGQVRSHKPVLLYWLMMASYAAFGQTEFAARFPSAVLGVGTCVLTFYIARRLFGQRIGLWSGLILATSIAFNLAGRAATPDSTLIFFTTAALAAFVYYSGFFPQASRANSSPRRMGLSAAAVIYALMGLAMLAKGPVGFVLPGAIIGLFLLLRGGASESETTIESERPRQWSAGRALNATTACFHPRRIVTACSQMRLGEGLLISLLVAAPWYAWVGERSGGEWLYGFFWEHNYQRAAQAMENHSGGPWFYPAAILICFFPWSIFAIPAGLDMFGRMKAGDSLRPGYVFGLCWVGVYVGLFSLAKTKLPSYVTPCYPALAMLTAAFVQHWAERRQLARAWWPGVSLAVLGGVGVVLLVVLPREVGRFHLAGEEVLGLIGLIPIAGALAAAWLWRAAGPAAARRMVLGVAVLFVLGIFVIGQERVDRHQENGRLLAEAAARSDSPRLASLGTFDSTWVYYSGRTIREFQLEQATAAAEFLSGSPDAFLLVTASDLPHVQAALPPTVGVISEADFFLRRERLLLLGHRPPDETSSQQASSPAAARR